MIKILHNNQCSKSKAILEYLDENNVKFEIIDFIKDPLSKIEIRTVLKKLNCSPAEVIRIEKPDFKKLNLDVQTISNEDLVDLFFQYPNIIQRPILIKNKIAMIGRPLENVKFFIGK